MSTHIYKRGREETKSNESLSHTGVLCHTHINFEFHELEVHLDYLCFGTEKYLSLKKLVSERTKIAVFGPQQEKESRSERSAFKENNLILPFSLCAPPKNTISSIRSLGFVYL